jgi:hypothetical protein
MLENIIVKVPDEVDLREYLFQIIFQNFGLSLDVREYLAETNSGFGVYNNHLVLDVLSDDEIKTVLEERRLLPEYLYFFRSDERSWNGKILESDYQKIPEFFTDVRDVYYVNNEVEFIVMEHFNSQIYSLYDKNGNILLRHCHDIEIGPDDKILIRTSEDVWWEYYQFNGNKLDFIDTYMPFETPKDFIGISGSKVEIYYPDINENPKLILKGEELTNKTTNGSIVDDSYIDDELSDLPF